MGRRKIFEFEKYVIFNEQSNLSTCLICQKILKGKVSSNIKRHYEKLHNVIIDESDLPSSSINSVAKRTCRSAPIHLNKNEFLACCVGLVTVKNIPFRLFDDEEYFKKIIRPYEDLHEVCINSKNIVGFLNTAANGIKELISKYVLNKMISLKIDVATRMEKSILGINIQYIKDAKIHINTVGMIQLRRRHTGQFLKEEIINCLKEFKIDVSQIYSITSDNGANVIKAGKLLQELQEESLPQETDIDSDDDDFMEVHSSLTSVMAVVRCAAHTIQLAAYDVIKTINLELEECRKIVKNLRTSIRSGNLTSLQMPILDNATRWNSSFKMILSLRNFKEYIESSSISEPNWNFVNKFISAFKPLSECTNKFQFEQYIVGDFYRDWLCCEIELEELEGENIYAKLLLSAMKERKECLLKNDAFISAIYLDPRFNFIRSPVLSDPQKKSAVDHLLKTYDVIKRLEGQSTDVQETSITNPSNASSSDYSKLDAKFNILIENTPPTDRTTKQKLENLCNAEKAPFNSNILDFWKYSNVNDPDLQKILDVALAVPSTQVSVERSFSALSTILTKLRSRLSKDSINNLLLVKLNKNLIDYVQITSETSE